MANIPRPKELCLHKATWDLWQGLEVPGKERPRVRPVPRNIQCRARSLQPDCSPPLHGKHCPSSLRVMGDEPGPPYKDTLGKLSDTPVL